MIFPNFMPSTIHPWCHHASFCIHGQWLASKVGCFPSGPSIPALHSGGTHCGSQHCGWQMGNWMQYACQISSCNGSFGLLWGDISTCVPYVCAELHYVTRRILHKHKTHTSGVILTRETEWNKAERVFWKFNTGAQDDWTTSTLEDSRQQFKAWKVLFICVPHSLRCVHNEVAKAALNKALMNLSSSRLGRAADRTGCGDCQPSTWDSWAACWAAWLTGWLLTALWQVSVCAGALSVASSRGRASEHV